MSAKVWVKGLDSLRFVLAFIVLLSHYPNPYVIYLNSSENIILKALGSGIGMGFCGIGAVIAFFVLSGFVIHLPNTKEFKNIYSYFIRRYIRIVAPLLVIALISLQLNCFEAIPIWSLYCEIIYYTIYPLLNKIASKKWLKILIPSFVISFVLIFTLAYPDVLSFLHQKNVKYDGRYWQFGPFITWALGLPCWLLGVYLAQEFRDNPVVKVGKFKIYVVRFVVYLVSVFLVAVKFHFYFGYILSMNLFAIFVYYWIRFEIYYSLDKPGFKFLEFLGSFSYSIYLCHGVFLIAVNYFTPINMNNYFLVVFGAIVFSYFYYLLFERPFHKLAIALSNKILSKSVLPKV